MNHARVERACRFEEWMHGGDSWGLVIVRRGRIVREHYTFNVTPWTRFDAWSCTKSFTSIAWGALLDDRPDVGLDSAVYERLPQAAPLSDPSKREITLEHLLGMTSGIPGESIGAIGTPTGSDTGPFEHAFGHAPNRYGISVGRLHARPGRRWDYSDPAFAHLSPLFARLAGVPIDEYLAAHVLGPIGIESVSWTAHGGGTEGSHPNAHTGVMISVRDLARVGWLMLERGRWGTRRLLPEAWVQRSTATPGLNPSYALGWWTNTGGTWLPAAPRDAFGASGYRSNRCYVVPSRDLVVARLGTGPAAWEEGSLLGRILEAIDD